MADVIALRHVAGPHEGHRRRVARKGVGHFLAVDERARIRWDESASIQRTHDRVQRCCVEGRTWTAASASHREDKPPDVCMLDDDAVAHDAALGHEIYSTSVEGLRRGVVLALDRSAQRDVVVEVRPIVAGKSIRG